ncbi:hypothetical protein GGH95_004063, partial [Coemansia sp. RSA 1836]
MLDKTKRKAHETEDTYRLQIIDHVGAQAADFDSVNAAITRAADSVSRGEERPPVAPKVGCLAAGGGGGGGGGDEASEKSPAAAEATSGLQQHQTAEPNPDVLRAHFIEMCDDKNSLVMFWEQTIERYRSGWRDYMSGKAAASGDLPRGRPMIIDLFSEGLWQKKWSANVAAEEEATSETDNADQRSFPTGGGGGGTDSRHGHTFGASDSIPLVAQYEFLGEPVVHGLSVHKKRGLDTTEHRLDAQLKLGSMIGDDSGHTMFHVEVRAFNTTYALLVEANTDLVHGAATMTRTAANGRRVQSSLATHDIGVFRGHVLRVGAVQPAERSLSLRRWAAALQPMSFDANGSWARLAVFRDAAGRAVVDGAFSVGGETFYVKPAHTYMRTKRAADPALANPLARAAELRLAASIVYRQADLISEIKGASGGG